MPVVAAQTGTLGGIATASLTGPLGGIGGLFVGMPGLPYHMAPFADAFLLAPGTEIAQAFGVFGPPLASSYTVPMQAQLLGTRVAWQGVSIGATSGAQVSNRVTYVQW